MIKRLHNELPIGYAGIFTAASGSDARHASAIEKTVLLGAWTDWATIPAAKTYSSLCQDVRQLLVLFFLQVSEYLLN